MLRAILRIVAGVAIGFAVITVLVSMFVARTVDLAEKDQCNARGGVYVNSQCVYIAGARVKR